jgi:hypothetical protein
MKFNITILFFLIGLSCNFQKVGNDMDVYEITQGTATTIEGFRVGCMATFRGKYLASDGSEKRGVAAILHIEEGDKEVKVGCGSHFKIKGNNYEVDKVLNNNLFRRRGIVYFHKE